MKKLAIGLCASALALAGVSCGDPSTRGSGELNALQAAAEAVEGAGSSRMEMEMTMTVAGVDVTAFAEGAFDYDDQVGEATMTLSSSEDIPGLDGETKMIADGTGVYMKGGPMSTNFGVATDGWIFVDMSDMPGMSSAQMNQDPSQYIDFLRGASGDIENVGTEEVRGTPAVHYRTEITLDDIVEYTEDENSKRFAEQLEEMGAEIEPVPTDVWIADDGLPRRIRMEMTMTGVPELPDGEMTIDIAIDLFDYGVRVDVKPPKKFEEGELPGMP